MLIVTQRDVKQLLTGLLLSIMLVSVPFGFAQAHERFFSHRALPYPYAQRDPSNPWSPSPPVGYVSVTSELQSYRPVDPLPWGDVNKRVMPPAKPAPGTEKEK